MTLFLSLSHLHFAGSASRIEGGGNLSCSLIVQDRENRTMETRTEIFRTVEESGLAVNMKSGSLRVLATPQMIAWMEEAACLLAPLEEGQTSVGIRMDVSHDAPSALGAKIRIEAELKEVRGKILTYHVAAWCDETCIGKGEHVRAIVNADRFMAKLQG